MKQNEKNLKEYIREDNMYQDYIKGTSKELSDFDMFCINHCQDIAELLNEVEKLRNIIAPLDFIKNRASQGANQENINEMAINFVSSYLSNKEDDKNDSNK